MRRIYFVLALTALAFAPWLSHAATVPSPVDLKSVVPGSTKYEHKLSPVDYYELQGAQGRSLGVAFITSSIPPEVGGYRGELDILVGMDWDGRITGVKIIGHAETPDHIDRILKSGFLNRFVGKIAGDDFSDIEAVTGATISSQAIIDDVRTAAKAVYDRIRGRGSGPAAGLGGFLRGSQWPEALGALGIVALAVVSAFAPKRRRLRLVALIASFAVVGVWLGSPITIGNIVDLRYFGLPLANNLPLAILIVFAAVAALAKGNLYCSYVCPFGALQEGAARILSKKLRPDERVTGAFRWLRWIVTILAVYAIAALGSDAFRSVEPFSLLFVRYPGTVTIVQAAVVLAAAVFIRRVWCRFLCPTGLLIDIVAQLGAKLRHFIKERARKRHAEG